MCLRSQCGLTLEMPIIIDMDGCFVFLSEGYLWVHFTIEESYILGNTIFDLVKMGNCETCR